MHRPLLALILLLLASAATADPVAEAFHRDVSDLEERLKDPFLRNDGADELFVVYADLEALLLRAPPQVAEQYADRLLTLQGDFARDLMRFDYGEHAIARREESIRRYRAYFAQVAVTDRSHLEHLARFAEGLERSERLDEAAQVYRQALEHAHMLPWSSKFGPSSLFQSLMSITHGPGSETYRAEMAQYLLTQPEDYFTVPFLRDMIGNCMQRKAYDEAILLAQRWSELDAEDLWPRFRLGQLLMLSGRLDEAEAAFEQVRTMAGIENTFVLMAENELHAIRSGHRAKGNFLTVAWDRVVDTTLASMPETGAQSNLTSADPPDRGPAPSDAPDWRFSPLTLGVLCVGVAIALGVFLALHRA